MDIEDRAEWMEDNGKRQGEDWIPVQGRPKQEFCDLRLRDGTEVIGPFWPRTTTVDFVEIDNDQKAYDFCDVACVRYYEDAEPENEDDEDEEEEA